VTVDAKRHEGEARPLHLTPFQDLPQYRKALIAAKERAGISEQLRPVTGFPGCGRVIVLGDALPDFACDYANIRFGSSLDLCSEVLAWYVSGKHDPRAKSMADWLSAVMGTEVREIVK
jgi:hypothetical protein